MTDQHFPRYWVGGYTQGALDDFKHNNYWQFWKEKGAQDYHSQSAWKLFEQIKVGDLFAIKGLGGKGHLKVYYVGRVVEKYPEGRLKLAPMKIDKSLPFTYKVGKGEGAYFGTLAEVGSPAVRVSLAHTSARRTTFATSAVPLS